MFAYISRSTEPEEKGRLPGILEGKYGGV